MPDPFDSPNELVDITTGVPAGPLDPVNLFNRTPVRRVAPPPADIEPEPPPLPGILETAAEAVKFGFRNTAADLVQYFGTIKELPESTRVANAYKVDAMRMNAINKASDSYKRLLLSERSEAPVLHTVNDVATQLPLFATAAGTTVATRNPFAGGAVFTPTIWTSFYNEALNGGVAPERARDLSTLNAAFAMVTESSIPQTGFLKGGTIVKRLVRGAVQEGLIEEGIQGAFETTLKTYGWRDPANLARDLADEVPPQIIAGAILGGATGAAIPANISEYTRDEIKNKLQRKLNKIGKDKGMHQSQVDKTVENLMSVYDVKEAFLKDRFDPSKMADKLKENPDLLKDIGFVETIKDGEKQVAASPWPLFDKEVRRQAQDIATSALEEVRFGLDGDKRYKFTEQIDPETKEKIPALPPHVQQVAKTKAAELIEDGLTTEEVHEEMVKFYEKLGGLENVYLSSIGKEQGETLKDVGTTVPVFSFAYGHTTAGQLADELKLSQPERGKPYSVLPKNIVLQGSTTVFDQEREATGQTKSAIEGVHKAIVEAYEKSERAEVLPPDEEGPETGPETLGSPESPGPQPKGPVPEQPTSPERQTLDDLIANDKMSIESIQKALGILKYQAQRIMKQYEVMQSANIVDLFGVGGVSAYLTARFQESMVYANAFTEIGNAVLSGKLPNSPLFQTNQEIQALTQSAIDSYNQTLDEMNSEIGPDITQEQLAESDASSWYVQSIMSEASSLVYPGMPGFIHDTFNDPVASSVFNMTEQSLAALNNYLNTPDLQSQIGIENVGQLELTSKILEQIDKANSPMNANEQAMEAVNSEIRDTGRFDDFTATGYADSNVTLDSAKTSILAKIIAVRNALGVLFKNNPAYAITTETQSGKLIIASNPTLQKLLSLHEMYWQQLEASDISKKTLNALRKQASNSQLDSFLTNREMEQSEWSMAVAQFIKDGKPIVGFTSDVPINVVAVEAPAGQVQGVNVGKAVEISGPFVVDTSNQAEGKILIKNSEWVWVTPAQLSKIINLSNFLAEELGVQSPVKTQFLGDQNIAMGGKLPPKPPDAPSGGYDGDFDDEHQKSNYNQFKATGDQDAHDPVDIPGDPRPVPLRSFFKSLGILKFPSQVKKYLSSLFGKSKEAQLLETEREKRKAMSLDDQVMEQLFQDRFFQDLADTLALSQLEPLRRRLNVIVQERIAPKIVGGKPTSADVKKIDALVQGLMQFAAEEIFTKKGNANAYSLTDIGAGGLHLSFEEGEAHLRWMEEFYKGFGLQFDVNDQNNWLNQRDPLAFFNLLGQIDPELQAMLNYYKAEIEYPVLEAGLKVGLFKSANMWTNISRGFMHRLAVKQPTQQELTRGGPNALINRPNISGQNYRTMGEFASEAEGFGLLPEMGFFAAAREYVRDYVTYVQQAQSAQSLKGILANNPNMVRYTPKDQAEAEDIDDLVSQTALVEYTNSKTIKDLAKITGKKPQDILTDLGYVQDPGTPGLAVWSGGRFSQPWVYAPLSDALRSIFAPANTPEEVRATNSVFNFGKRFLTYNPYDATFLWLSAVLVNSSPTELVRLFTDYTKTVFTDLPFIGKTGRSILKGDFFPIGDLNLTSYENLPLFIAKGFTAFGYHPAMAAQWDDYQLGKFPTDLTTGERISEYFKSFGGVNAAIFNTLIAQKLYHVTDKFYQRNLQKVDPATGKLMTPDKAASLAVSAVNDFSFLVHPAIYGKKTGPFKTLLLFTRGLTIGFMRQLTLGGLYPILPQAAKEKLFKFRSKGVGSFVNDLFHGEKSQVDMALLAPQYTLHIAKVFTAGLLLNGLIQFGLSFMDDDEKDEHGERCSGELSCKKRWMFMNEPGKRFSVRLPNQAISVRDGRRTYLNFQMLREASHIGKILFDQLPQEGIPTRGIPGFTADVLGWGANRLNFGIGLIGDWWRNEDRTTGQPIWTRGSSAKDKADDFGDFLKEEFKPLGFSAIGRGFEKVPGIRDTAIPNVFIRRGEDIRTVSEGIDISLALIEFFGGTARKGEEFQPGYTIADLKKLQRAKVEEDINARRNRKALLEGADPFALVGPDTGLSASSARDKRRQEFAPVGVQMQRGKKALIRERMFADKNKAESRRRAAEQRKEAIKKGRERRKQK